MIYGYLTRHPNCGHGSVGLKQQIKMEFMKYFVNHLRIMFQVQDILIQWLWILLNNRFLFLVVPVKTLLGQSVGMTRC